jgi:transcriptional regulator with XRE-family HTH domain
MSDLLPRTLGRRLREERRRSGLSLRALASRSGLSTTTVHQIEIGRGSPSLATLHALATTLGVPLPSLLVRGGPPVRRGLSLDGKGRRAIRAAHGDIDGLASGLPDQKLHGLILTLAPGAETGPEPMVHTGQEMVFGLSGRCVYEIEGEEHPIGPGDSLVLDSRRPHKARTRGRRPARLLLVLYGPRPRRPSGVTRHGGPGRHE